MAQLEQPSASTNTKATVNSAPASDAAHQPARSDLLPAAGLLIALAVAAGAFVYYQKNEETAGPAAQTTTSNDAAAPSGTSATPEGAAPALQSASAAPDASASESHTRALTSAAPSGHATSGKPHQLARTSKPRHVLEPRDRQVALTSPPHPAYPLQALRAGEEGTVLVLAQVDVNGQVTDARVVRHSGSRILDRAAPDEVRHWKFAPALHDGQPIVASVEVPVHYQLNE